ncbi:6-phosphofructokinase [Maledivibacter halophilus]|uniref:ATP-dependent 6-phosphofructokinase n=1 Tax=Maledivibacter halophilus TaxID=36842 RepID=A0A1T5MX67_9FIRM|nr:6-phosphofructokinase [Maledivibacter halophilus]SKC92807.1 6-phosphofructokinase [Maledivibacter halophilus]
MKKIGVLTSGGDAPGMNAAIRSVVRTAIFKGLKVVGIKRGYQGLLEGDIEEMNLSSVGDIIHRGGTILRSARSKEFINEKGFQKALDVLKIFGIDGLVVIGGDGSFKGAKKLSESGISTIGIPGTIDNDLGYTDYTIGFDTAINTVVNAIGNLRDTSSSHGRANIVEVMGRHCGDIALYSGLAGGAESIIIPEIKFSMEEICKKLISGRNRGKLHSIIIVAEGVGKPYDIADEINRKTSIETRVTIMGHLQRGGTPTAQDRILASRLGSESINLLLKGEKGRAIGLKENKIVNLDIDEALKANKAIDKDMYELTKILSI